MIDILNPFYCGTALVAIGFLYVIKALFGITIPAFRVLCGSLLAYAGVCVIIGSSSPDHKITVFEKTQYTDDATIRCYSDVCSQITHDLSSMSLPCEKRIIELNNVLGSTEILLNPAIPTVIKMDRACAQTRFTSPLANNTYSWLGLIKNLFGSYSYTTHDAAVEPLLEIRSRAAFGTIVIHNDALLT
jgi:hypothetical protein